MVRSRVILALVIILSIGNYSCSKRSLKTIKEPVLGMEFILIPKGSYEMGDFEITDTTKSESLHKVTISKDFWMGKTEVTQNQWQKIMGNEEIHPEKPSPFRSANPDYPVVSISFFDIEIFLEKLNELSNDYHFRLPTEAEWEYACRAGTTTPFSYGASISDSLANFNASVHSEYSALGSFLEHPAAVGSYPPNQWGLFDMHGNVWEWVSDWYAPYSNKEVTDPKGPIKGKEKLIRGGSWYFGADNAKSSNRRKHEPGLWGFSIGFRLVCEKR